MSPAGKTTEPSKRLSLNLEAGRRRWAEYMGQDFARYLGLGKRAVIEASQDHPDRHQRAVAHAVLAFLNYLGHADHGVDEAGRFSATVNYLRDIHNG